MVAAHPLEYATFGQRFAAMLLDTLALSLLLVPLGMVVGGSGRALSLDLEQGLSAALLQFGQGDPADTLLNDLLPLLLTVALWVRYGGTPGKLLLGCRVVDLKKGRDPGVGQSLLRYIGYLISLLPLGLGFLWILWDRRGQGFHDKLAGTVVLADESSRWADPVAERPLVQLMREVE